jgi:hypothetical protein
VPVPPATLKGRRRRDKIRCCWNILPLDLQDDPALTMNSSVTLITVRPLPSLTYSNGLLPPATSDGADDEG